MTWASIRYSFVLVLLTSVAAASPSNFKITQALDVYFAPRGEALDAAQRDRLDILVLSRVAHPCALEHVVVVGHADALEASASQVPELSRRRAEFVKELLVRRGIPRDRVYAISYGAKMPVDSAGSAKNRRVELEAVGNAWPHCPLPVGK